LPMPGDHLREIRFAAGPGMEGNHHRLRLVGASVRDDAGLRRERRATYDQRDEDNVANFHTTSYGYDCAIDMKPVTDSTRPSSLKTKTFVPRARSRPSLDRAANSARTV